MKSLTLKAENSLFHLLKDELKDFIINNKKINFQKGYLKEEGLKEKLNSESSNNTYPLLLLRRGRFKQTLNNGILEKKQEFIIMLGIKEGIKEGYENIEEFGEEVLNTLNLNSYLLKGFALEQGAFNGGVNNELSGGDYWLYEIKLNLIIPVLESDLGGRYD